MHVSESEKGLVVMEGLIGYLLKLRVTNRLVKAESDPA
jgi:hypothetical protein